MFRGKTCMLKPISSLPKEIRNLGKRRTPQPPPTAAKEAELPRPGYPQTDKGKNSSIQMSYWKCNFRMN